MRPAFSVILLTTLIGAGQGLFIALYLVELGVALGRLPAQDAAFYAAGGAAAVVLLTLGLVASFFHLGRPARAWRAVVMWRTSWLSREVIVLPAFMAMTAAWALAHHGGAASTPWLGAIALALGLLLFLCTGMIYVCVRFLREWATPLTVVNYLLLGCASGFTAAAAGAAIAGSGVAVPLGFCAVGLTLAGWAGRAAALARNARLAPRSTLQTATGVGHPRIAQKAQGFMGGSFNTREFRHGRTATTVRRVKWAFLTLSFPLPVLLLAAGLHSSAAALFTAAFLVQFAGLVAERWYFFAEASHPQNLYYQAMS